MQSSKRKESELQKQIFTIFHDINEANHAVDRLLAAGIGHRHISTLTSEAGGAKHLALSQSTKAVEGGSAGASIGGVIGLLAGAVITAATGGVGLLAAGPIVIGLAGLGAGAAAGGLVGVLVGTGIPEAEAKLYATEIAESDAILIGVEVTDSDRNLVRDILSGSPIDTPARV